MDLGSRQRGTTLFSPYGIGIVVANHKMLLENRPKQAVEITHVEN
jgi:hypothetical protein